MLCYLVKMLPTEHSEHRVTFLQAGEGPARSVFLSRHSREVQRPITLCAISHATMTVFAASSSSPHGLMDKALDF